MDKSYNQDMTTAMNPNGQLMSACRRGSISLIKRALELGAQLGPQGTNEGSALHVAAKHGRLVAVQYLLSLGADPNAIDLQGLTPMHWATSDVEICMELSKAGGAVQAMSGVTGETPLHRCVLEGRVDAAAFLIGQGCEVDKKNAKGHSPLWLALDRRRHDMATLLIRRGAQDDLDVRDHSGVTPAIWATIYGNEKMLAALLSAGCGREIKCQYGQTAATWAVKCDKDGCLAMLIDAGCELDGQDLLGKTAAMYAAENGRDAILGMLIGAGCDLEKQDVKGNRALHWAARSQRNGCLAKLIKSGCDLNAKNNDGATAAMASTLIGNSADLGLLMEAGCDLDIEDAQGRTAMKHAQEAGLETCLAMIRTEAEKRFLTEGLALGRLKEGSLRI